jgi:hypothetical protein
VTSVTFPLIVQRPFPGRSLFNAQLTEDIQWLTGYEAGLAGAEATRAGEPLNGPGATPFPKDGWSASSIQRDAYQLGLVDGERLA